MFPFSPRSKMSDAPETPPTPSKASEPHPLDALTGGAFSAATSGERASRVREWLATQPPAERLQEVFKELSARDKGAARPVRERLDELRRAQAQEAMAAEWAAKAEGLLAAPRLNIADAMAWQRDAARAGAPLSREPLSQLKARLAERVKTIEDLQHRVQVQREAAVLLAQRIEVLSTKPWRDAQAALPLLNTDVERWQAQALELSGDDAWASVEPRFPAQLESSRAQLLVVWEAFQLALSQTVAASEDAAAPLPSVPVWADELRQARGVPTEAEKAAIRPPAAPARPKADPAQREAAEAAVREALTKLQEETAQGHGKASAGAATALRGVLKVHGKLIGGELEQQVHAALVAAGELQGWQRWSADQVREELVARAEALVQRPEGQALGGRKMQETLRQLREQWKQADQGAPANHALWKRFDEACNNAHKVVEAWLDKVRTESAQNRAQRMALIDEVKAWTAEQASTPSNDWKAASRVLHQFGERWRSGGHLSEKVFAELQPLWKQALSEAGAPLAAAQKASLAQRHAMIEEASALGEANPLRIDAVKALQQRWQAEAQAVPLDRRQEQKLWDAFRKPIDEAFARKSAAREQDAAQLGARDRAVLEASKALEAANASGDVQRIRSAMAALDTALREQHGAASEAKAAPAQAQQAEGATKTVVPEEGVAASDQSAPDEAGQEEGASTADAAPAPSPAPARPVVAVRGDDRPGARKPGPAHDSRAFRPGERHDRGGERRPRDDAWGRGRDRGEQSYDRGPRLGDAAFRAQREAMEQAQATLRKLAAQAHGEALAQLMDAWKSRDAAQIPAAQALGGKVSSAGRGAWVQALSGPVQGDASDALLRLEIAAEVPTPAEQLSARRALQLQLLTRRNDPSPAQTWEQDAARVLASAGDEARARRLQNALKVLMRK